ncbi:LysM peptidoglycan-binding domain-containing M23 family metallopeptidase [Streptomyces sp. HNM0574]|uniref:M23 family metallopeptidase n=1 Tax=Streptomyces sp. HNM0574 TaxID=2714954 RepID=UPI001469C9A9|nr:LysM peptidoglycan-binding domain-containing M23 family metallopeptidase [Streptomyces sp. HNM0574]NLU70629.1 peptidoglycan DD-metalloendopeptidase family protein [Streptomyces sp. HNM0574]
MSARGRHRRSTPGPLARTSFRVTAGGAGIALPLTAAQLAQATPPEAADTADHAPRTAPAAAARAGQAPVTSRAAERDARAEQARRERAERATTYEVVGGDSLFAISERQDVEGGWQALYARNRPAIGPDPDLIRPGQRLELGGGGGGAEGREAGREGERAEERAAERAEERRAAARAEKQRAEKRRAEEKAAEERAAAERERAAVRAERERERAAASAPVSGVGPGTAYRVSGGNWSSGYHTGVDFPVATGTSVRAVGGGRVVSAGWADAYGYQVVLRHDDGKYSQYAHLSAISVSAGQSVNSGQRLGRSGATGNVTGPHLHFEIRTGPGYGTDINPLAYLRARGVRL